MRADGHKLIRQGSVWKTICPWHLEKTPSCAVYDDHAFCFGCHRHVSMAVYGRERGLGIAGVPTQFKKARELPAPDFDRILESAKGRRPVVDLAFDLGVEEESVAALDVRWLENKAAWAFPMRNHLGRTVGIRLRGEDGRKWAIHGSHDGLFEALRSVAQRRLYVCEGPSDTAAALSLGLFAVGRPSCRGAALTVVGFVQRWRISEVVIISDSDSVGLNGAKALQTLLSVPSCYVMTPAKDLRECVRRGMTAAVIEAIVKNSIWKKP